MTDSIMSRGDTPHFGRLHDAVCRIAQTVAAEHAADVDARARFPDEAVQALREAHLLSAAVPRTLGGAGCSLRELSKLCAALAHGCGSTAMVLAMHTIQVGCVARHCNGSALLEDYLRELVERQWLLASMTSEVGTYGDTRSSVCALERRGERFVLNKDATTGSYCAHADGIAVTCRRDADAASGDQLLVLVRREDAALTQTTSWDTLGMRGTCSPGFRLESSGPLGCVVPEPYADISAQTMVPWSHTLWSALWWGIASDAVRRAGQFVRAEARRHPGTVPPAALRLAEVSVQLQTMRHHWQSVAEAYDALGDAPAARQELSGIAWGLRLNNLKLACSEAAPQIVHRALQIVGILGYKNDTPFALGRHYRDLLSASLMVSNDRIASKSASMLLVLKDTP
jgi:acyl-CoA dehydrogenase